MANLTKEQRIEMNRKAQQERDLLERDRLAALPAFLLNLCVRAEKLGINVRFSEYAGKPMISFYGQFNDVRVEHKLTIDADSWTVQTALADIEEMEHEKERYAAKMKLRKEVIARLNDAEKDALGIKE
jgi:hypothetical protein